MILKALLLLFLSAVTLSACTLYKKPPVQLESKSDFEASVSADMKDPQTGEVDETKFEDAQKVSQDDSMSTLEAEIDGTVILEEDFSDL